MRITTDVQCGSCYRLQSRLSSSSNAVSRIAIAAAYSTICAVFASCTHSADSSAAVDEVVKAVSVSLDDPIAQQVKRQIYPTFLWIADSGTLQSCADIDYFIRRVVHRTRQNAQHLLITDQLPMDQLRRYQGEARRGGVQVFTVEYDVPSNVFVVAKFPEAGIGSAELLKIAPEDTRARPDSVLLELLQFIKKTITRTDR